VNPGDVSSFILSETFPIKVCVVAAVLAAMAGGFEQGQPQLPPAGVVEAADFRADVKLEPEPVVGSVRQVEVGAQIARYVMLLTGPSRFQGLIRPFIVH